MCQKCQILNRCNTPSRSRMSRRRLQKIVYNIKHTNTVAFMPVCVLLLLQKDCKMISESSQQRRSRIHHRGHPVMAARPSTMPPMHMRNYLLFFSVNYHEHRISKWIIFFLKLEIKISQKKLTRCGSKI